MKTNTVHDMIKEWQYTIPNMRSGPVHPYQLDESISTFRVKALVLSYPLSAQRRLWSDWADAQADLSLRRAHSHFISCVMRRLNQLVSFLFPKQVDQNARMDRDTIGTSPATPHTCIQYTYNKILHSIISSANFPFKLYQTKQFCTLRGFGDLIWAASSEFVSSSIPSWQISTAHAQPLRGARDLAFCLKVPLDSLLIWASSEGSGETARMRRLAWTFAARIGDKYQIRLTRSIL